MAETSPLPSLVDIFRNRHNMGKHISIYPFHPPFLYLYREWNSKMKFRLKMRAAWKTRSYPDISSTFWGLIGPQTINYECSFMKRNLVKVKKIKNQNDLGCKSTLKDLPPTPIQPFSFLSRITLISRMTKNPRRCMEIRRFADNLTLCFS